VNVTDWPKYDGFADDDTVVVVAAGASVKVRLQPDTDDGFASPASSSAYKLQVPLGTIPLKIFANVPVPSGEAGL
jgi:hypothetical protein